METKVYVVAHDWEDGVDHWVRSTLDGAKQLRLDLLKQEFDREIARNPSNHSLICMGEFLEKGNDTEAMWCWIDAQTNGWEDYIETITIAEVVVDSDKCGGPVI